MSAPLFSPPVDFELDIAPPHVAAAIGAGLSEAFPPVCGIHPTRDSTERWLPIDGFPYEVSDAGRVRRAPTSRYRNSTPDGVLKPVPIAGGYLKVSLVDRGRHRQELVHRLVAHAFLGPQPTPKHEVAHSDGTCTNNRATNLRWATHQENIDDRERHGRTSRGPRWYESRGLSV